MKNAASPNKTCSAIHCKDVAGTARRGVPSWVVDSSQNRAATDQQLPGAAAQLPRVFRSPRSDATSGPTDLQTASNIPRANQSKYAGSHC